MPKNRMKDMRVMSGTNSQAFPTSSPLYFRHSVLVRDDHVAFAGCRGNTSNQKPTLESFDSSPLKHERVSYYWAHIHRKIKGSNSQKNKDETSDGGQKEEKHPSLSSLTSPVLFQIQTEVPSKGSPKISVLFSAKAKFDFSKHNRLPKPSGLSRAIIIMIIGPYSCSAVYTKNVCLK